MRAQTLATEGEETEANSVIFEKQTTKSHNQSYSSTVDFLKRPSFDDCCRSRINLDQLVMEGTVKVRRRLFFYKRRQLYLLEDGTVFIVKDGHINNEFKLTKHTEITHICEGN